MRLMSWKVKGGSTLNQKIDLQSQNIDIDW